MPRATNHIKPLYTFQKEGTEKMMHFLENGEANSVYNASEMGTGKTIMTIECMNRLDPVNTLIVTLPVMRRTWKREIEEWGRRDYHVLVVEKSKDLSQIDSLVAPSVVVISYDLARIKKNLKLLIKEKFELLILDESHKVSNYNSLQTRGLLGDLWKTTKYRICLSGTPFTSRIVQGFTLFNKMMPSRFKSYFQFAEEFSEKTIKTFTRRIKRGREFITIPVEVTDYHGVKKPEVLSQIIRENFYVRYTKKENLKELPPVNYQKILLPNLINKGNKYSENKVAESLLKILDGINDGKTIKETKEVTNHRVTQGLAKVPLVVSFAEELLLQGLPIVIFCYHHAVIDEYKKALEKYAPRTIDGRVGPGIRQEAIDDFQKGKFNCLILQVSAGGVGITLTKSSHVLYAETTYVPSELEQSVARVHRIGQRDIVQVFYFVVENSLDEAITDVVMERIKTFKKVLDE